MSAATVHAEIPQADRVQAGIDATMRQIAGAEAPDLAIRRTRQHVEDHRRLGPPREVKLLVLFYGFYANHRSHLKTRRVARDADPEHPAIEAVDEALTPLHRSVIRTRTSYGTHVAVDGFDLETGVAGVEIDVPGLVRDVRPAAVLLVTGPEADLLEVGVQAGWLTHQGIPVYRHDTRGRRIGCYDRVMTRFAKTSPLTPEEHAALNPRITAAQVVESRSHGTLVDTGRVSQLLGRWESTLLAGLPCDRFIETRWSRAQLKAASCRFGKCLYWKPSQAQEHGVTHLCPELFGDPDAYPVEVDLCPHVPQWQTPAPGEQPLTFAQVRDDYWRALLSSGILHGAYRQQVRQYVERVIGPTHDGLVPELHHEMERRDFDFSLGSAGVPECSAPVDKTPTGHWGDDDVFRNTGAQESTPRHWVDLSPFLRRGDASPVEEPQHLAVSIKPWAEYTDEDLERDEDAGFRASILADQDEYDDIGSWAHDATPQERARFHARMLARAGGYAESIEARKRRLDSYAAAWLEHVLDMTDAIRRLVPHAETCRYATQAEVDALPHDHPNRNAWSSESLEEDLNRLGRLPPDAQAWLRDLEADARHTVRRGDTLGVWSDFLDAGRAARNAIASARARLADPEGFFRQQLALEALDARPDWAPALVAGDPRLATELLGDLMPPAPKLTFGMRMAKRKLARRLLESGAEAGRAARKATARWWRKHQARKRRLAHAIHLRRKGCEVDVPA